jgi:hypothetical protein
MVIAAATSPAAAYPRCRSCTTCRVRVTLAAVAGMRANSVTINIERMPGRASVCR